MILCLIWFLIYCIIGVIILYIAATALKMIAEVPPQVYILLRLLVMLLILLWLLSCVGLLPHVGPIGRMP
jgi:hypothetical protein